MRDDFRWVAAEPNRNTAYPRLFARQLCCPPIPRSLPAISYFGYDLLVALSMLRNSLNSRDHVRDYRQVATAVSLIKRGTHRISRVAIFYQVQTPVLLLIRRKKNIYSKQQASTPCRSPNSHTQTLTPIKLDLILIMSMYLRLRNLRWRN